MKWIVSILIFLGIVFLWFLYGSVIDEELRYRYNQMSSVKYSLDTSPIFPEEGLRYVAPQDKKFGIVICKINLNLTVFPDVDNTKPAIYLPIFKKGVAHVKGSAYPGELGSVLILGHHDDNFYNTGRYNAKFYLINKLENNDIIDIFFNNKRYQYKVIDKIITTSKEKMIDTVNYKDGEYLILQTGSPQGTLINKLFVVAKIVE